MLAVRRSEPRMECYVANPLGEDEDGPHELSIDIFPKTAASGPSIRKNSRKRSTPGPC